MAKIKSKPEIKKRKVTFLMKTSDAQHVMLIGDFNNWNPKKDPMHKTRTVCGLKPL